MTVGTGNSALWTSLEAIRPAKSTRLKSAMVSLLLRKFGRPVGSPFYFDGHSYRSTLLTGSDTAGRALRKVAVHAMAMAAITSAIATGAASRGTGIGTP